MSSNKDSCEKKEVEKKIIDIAGNDVTDYVKSCEGNQNKNIIQKISDYSGNNLSNILFNDHDIINN